MNSFVIPFDMINGKIKDDNIKPLERRLSNLKGIFSDEKALSAKIEAADELVYEFYDLGIEEKEGNLAFGTSIVSPGVVGEEFFMTKGHFHTVLETAEVYLCLSGHGLMMMESPEGDVQYQELHPGEAVYVPGRYAHRSVNLSLEEKLVTFYVFPADAGHDYGTIEQKGFRKLVVKDGEGYSVVDNPAWKGD
jgi:glucose-6-phosphate isomerase